MRSDDENGRTQSLVDSVLEYVETLRPINAVPLPRCNVVELATREEDLHCAIPSGLRILYGVFGGVDPDTMPISENDVRVWPLSELRVAGANESGEFGACFVFADVLLSSFEYGVSVQTNKVVMLGGLKSKIVADDLGSFLRKCVANDPSVYGVSASS